MLHLLNNVKKNGKKFCNEIISADTLECEGSSTPARDNCLKQADTDSAFQEPSIAVRGLYSPEGAHRNLCPVQASSYQSCNSILPQASSYKSDIRHFSVDDEDYDSLCDRDKQRLL